MPKRKPKVGDLVRIRSQEEILATLDEQGCLDGMPVMPEMLKFCGMTLRVQARAHKTCDTVNNTGGVWVEDAVHLESARCDGAYHDGCQAACLLFWRMAWVDPVSSVSQGTDKLEDNQEIPTLPRSWSRNSPRGTPASEKAYRCQATELPGFVRPMKWWDIRQYVEDLTSRNIGIRKLLRGMWDSLSYTIVSVGIGYRAWKKIYNGLQRLRGSDPFYWEVGKLSKTPGGQRLDLRPGDSVRIKPFDEIMATLNTKNLNRGMGFDPGEMGMHCGKTLQVDQLISQFINDRTGKMVFFKEPTVTLKGVYCSGERSNVRKFCPRAITPYWREIWLERTGSDVDEMTVP